MAAIALKRTESQTRVRMRQVSYASHEAIRRAESIRDLVAARRPSENPPPSVRDSDGNGHDAE